MVTCSSGISLALLALGLDIIADEFSILRCVFGNKVSSTPVPRLVRRDRSADQEYHIVRSSYTLVRRSVERYCPWEADGCFCC